MMVYATGVSLAGLQVEALLLQVTKLFLHEMRRAALAHAPADGGGQWCTLAQDSVRRRRSLAPRSLAPALAAVYEERVARTARDRWTRMSTPYLQINISNCQPTNLKVLFGLTQR